MGGLLLALILLAWGAQAVAPWRLRRGDTPENPAARRLWGHAALPLLLAGALAALLYVHDRPDAALGSGLTPILVTLPGRLLVLLFAALLLADLILALGKSRIETLGWPLAAVLSLFFLAAASLAGELLRVGENERGPLPLLFAAAGCRLLLTLAAGEGLAPGRPLLALLGGLALPLYFLCLPRLLQARLAAGGEGITLAAAALLLLLARWLPASLRRATLLAGVLLAAFVLSRAGDLGQSLPVPPLPPMPPLPGR
ncbi:MAG TPA: hypothetical protein VFE33_12415 [Thermoanaerobaculia bacterium]|nr:hypothetical protein [Thermoanaerobaculia bacterium]